jgi:hypothetical protein
MRHLQHAGNPGVTRGVFKVMNLLVLIAAACGTAIPCLLLWAGDVRRRR